MSMRHTSSMTPESCLMSGRQLVQTYNFLPVRPTHKSISSEETLNMGKTRASKSAKVCVAVTVLMSLPAVVKQHLVLQLHMIHL